mmetsp:Transcript_27004/g.30116  ORF Transcript_27004/g.30116 Transcript_27004/m.30116 type:complete len:164 (+) Transcript_27004:91-582(+)
MRVSQYILIGTSNVVIAFGLVLMGLEIAMSQQKEVSLRHKHSVVFGTIIALGGLFTGAYGAIVATTGNINKKMFYAYLGVLVFLFHINSIVFYNANDESLDVPTTHQTFQEAKTQQLNTATWVFSLLWTIAAISQAISMAILSEETNTKHTIRPENYEYFVEV